MSEISIKKLKNPDSRSFFNELQNAEENLTKKEAKLFFKTVLSHFEYDIPVKTGNSILHSIDAVISDKGIADVFISNEFALFLPFSQKSYASNIIEIFLQLVKIDPSVFSDDVTNSFSSLISRFPNKCLSIFAIFSKNCFDFEDRMSVFELIVKKNEIFINDDSLIPNYLSLLAFLCDNFSDFRKKRLGVCCKILSCVMKTAEIGLLKQCYNAIKSYQYLSPKLSQIKHDLAKQKILSTVINYLVLSPPLEVDADLIDILLTIANQDERGSLILFQIAENEENAEILIQNEDWLRMKLPTIEDTLKLLLVIFCHQELRNQVSNNPYFIKFLQTALKQNDANTGTLTVICTVLRRVDITKSIKKEIKGIHLLTTFFNKANDIGDNMAVHSAILLINTFAEEDYFPEFLDFVSYFCDLAKEDSPLSNVSAELLVHLSRYDKCLKIILKCGMEKFFKKKLRSKDKKMNKVGEEFFQILEDGYEYD
ncbi:hypothetical protein M9Y10_004323 [Tritrichomonas musculus]|uniref:Uncharacterized protein n=1 Tax=Tritrichomonas musculus TaxID=1915356 RepID=A0ABR2JRQ4_9EUKA